PSGPNLPLQCLPNEIHVQRHCNTRTVLDQSLWQKLRERITDHGLTPAGFLASIYALVLGKWSENKHFALNMPVFNRLPIHPQINQIAGDFTTVIPLEINLNKAITFYEFLQTVQKQLWNDLEHISYDGVSFIRDLMQLHQTREILLPYVFTCGVNVEDVREKSVEHNLFFDQVPVYAISQTPQVFLDHIVLEVDGCLSINWTYVESLLRKEMLNHMQNTFVDLLVKLASFDDIWQKPIFVPLPPEQQERRLDYNQTQWESNVKDKLLHSLVIKQAELTPNALAILSSQENLTYEQLMNRVYSLAYYLQQQHEIHSNQRIAVLIEKGWEQIVACLAILVSGGAYVPLDVDSPYDRLCSLIEETNITILLTQSHCKHRFPHRTTISVDTFTTNDNYPTPFPIKQQSSTDLAYVIYTSGSTGKPKGVMISHQAVVNTILDINSRLEISTNDRIFALSHLNFDLSVYDIFGILIGGGTIVLPDHEHYKNPQHWSDMIIQHHVTIWNSVPMLMQMFVEHLQHTNNHNQLRHILLSGDWVPLSLPESIQTTFGEQVTITSLGGATEASIWSIAYTLPKEIPQEWKSIPYGIPLRNQQYYVYDTHLDDCPEWVIGELYIGGEGLANGYLNDQEKTQSSFIIHPLTYERLYRTGDYGRFLPNGYIEFTGRKDFQVKVHGHRIELGEIEYQLQQHPDIHKAIVNIDDKSQQLIGYIMPANHSIHDKEYDSREMLIDDPIERINFKLARHSTRHQKKVEKSFALTKPKLTETLINTYYMRKSYRQFTNETIERSTIEKLLKTCQNSNNNEKISLSHLDFDILSQLLAVLTPISISDQPLPKYLYASAGSLYPVQIYIELPTSIDNILPGVYYHNPDEHTLELISSPINNEMMNIRLHLVGRSSAIAPLYGKRLGSQFCMLETGYVMGLLEKEGSRLGLTFSTNIHNESITRDILDIDENDTHCCFKISSFEQHISSNVQNDNHQCIIYLKLVNNNKDQWFIYNKENDTVTSFDVETETTQEEIPLFFDDDNDAKIIFHDCQCAIFFIGQPENTMNIGKMSHLLMDHCLEKNIGMCPIGTRTSFPKKINDVLDTTLIHKKLNGSNILHTLLIGKISNKQKTERTISKVKPMPNWSETLRVYLRKKLPMYMVPPHYISVSSFPLSSNGKIDRKLLPPPHFSSIHLTNSIELLLPINDVEVSIRRIWCELFKQGQISTDTNIFTIGGHSLLIMQLFHRYKIEFHLEQKQSSFSISNLFQHPTIIHHAQLVQQSINTIHALDEYSWSALHLTQARASFAQERIFLDEQIRFPSKHHNFMYCNPLVYRILTTNNHLSIDRLHRALHTAVTKHRVLRTGFYLDINGMIMQYCLGINATINDQEPYGFSVVNINSDVEIDEVIQKIISRSDLFDLSKGRVLNCHIVHRHDFGDLSYNEDTLIMGDLIIFTIHHIVFDGASISTFLNDLSVAYTNDCSLPVDENVMQCIDSTVYERLMDMRQSHEFWYSQLKDYNFARSIPLPFDRYCLSTDYRSGFQVVTEIYFDDDISAAFLEYATLHHITPFQLAMSIFYAFLFKLTDGQDDLCYSCLHANRHRTELQNIIGMFVATLPFRIQLNSQWSFEDLVKHVQENCLSIFQHTHYPLQYILADFRRNYSSVSFLDILFELVTVSPNINKLSLDESNLEGVSVEHLHEATYFDVDAVFVYNPTVETGKLLCNVYGSRDVFDETTVNTIGRKLQAVFSQIFTTKSRVDQIGKLSLTLPDEVEHMQKVTFRHLSDMNNKDYQIKSHGQRIELGEIEQCLLNTSISACVIIKWDDDHLIAYVDGCDMTENELYEYCQSYLPFHMIPSMFILLEKLPRNDNGTIDQDLLRKSHLPTVINVDSLSLIQLEARLSHIFSHVLSCESPDVTQSFSEMGGTSLDVLRMLSLIRKDICPIINGSLLFANPSIRQLARTIKALVVMHEGVGVDSS
ncbi:unnamed protein product, partial [Adineta steineri]